MRLPWRQSASTSEPAAAQTAPTTSDDWTAEIQALRDELARLDVERATLTTQAGAAVVDGHAAVVADLQNALASISTREQVVKAGITAAEERKTAALADEQRKRTTLLYREHTAMLAEYFRLTADVKACEIALTEATQARAAAVDRVALEGLYLQILNLGLTPQAGNVEQANPAGFKAEAARLRRLAEAVSIGDDGQVLVTGETIDVTAIPLTRKQQEIAALARERPAAERRQKLAEITQQLTDARQHELRLRNDRTVHPQDRERALARLAELEAERTELEAGGEVEKVEVAP